MSGATFFVQECPTCGRRLQIRVAFLGKMVRCQHCERNFLATEERTVREDTDDTHALLDRANELLECSSAQLRRPR